MLAMSANQVTLSLSELRASIQLSSSSMLQWPSKTVLLVPLNNEAPSQTNNHTRWDMNSEMPIYYSMLNPQYNCITASEICGRV